MLTHVCIHVSFDTEKKKKTCRKARDRFKHAPVANAAKDHLVPSQVKDV